MEEPLSRTEKKKAALSLQELGEQLVKLSNEQLRSMDLPESLFTAILLAKKTTKHVPLLRQMQYIGTLMRKYDTTAIAEFLHTIEEGNHKRTIAFKKIETWRDELVAGNDQVLETILAERPHGTAANCSTWSGKPGTSGAGTRPRPRHHGHYFAI
jgi:ribosome-associated protein